jgi:tRNA/tmRNA/rRNA uracil-C5-methylase (TrmA/RlmC/RlmD family)
VPDPPAVGTRLELTITAVAHGGSCVARHAGQVVFVRHALPGERVVAVITEARRGYCRADAVQVLAASPDRVSPPCPHAGPGRCGGCDWQHASAGAQRALKEAVVREQFARVAGLALDGVRGPRLREVEELPGGLLGWRTRIRYAVDPAGEVGLHKHRSDELERIERCVLGVPGVGDARALRERWPGSTSVELARGDVGPAAVLATRGRDRRPRVVSGPRRLRHRLGTHEFTVAASGFWQVHPAALAAISAAVLAAAAPHPGERVLDPPRAGAGRAIMQALLALRPRAVCYVSCDPATLARDVAVAAEQGWRLARLRAFDAFPMTHHVECVALLHPRGAPGVRDEAGDAG